MLRTTQCLILLLPFFYGGNIAHLPAALSLVLSLLSLLQFAALPRHNLNRAFYSPGPLRASAITLFLVCAFCLAQLIPLPSALSSVFFPLQEKYYSAVGSNYAYISFAPIQTRHSLGTLLALGVFSLCLTAHLQLQGQDLTSRLAQTLILSSLCWGMFALLHLALGTTSMLPGMNPLPLRLSENENRAHWPFLNANHLAVLMEMSAMIACAFGLERISQRKHNWLYFAAVFLLSLTALLSMSRAASALIPFGLLLQILYFRKLATAWDYKSPPLQRGLTTYAALMASLVLLFFLLGESQQYLFGTRLAQLTIDGLDNTRRNLLSATLAIIAQYPVFGVGLGCWSLLAGQFLSPSFGNFRLDFAHCDLLQFASELGLFAAAAVLLLAASLFRQTFRVLKNPPQTDTAPRQILLLGFFLALLLPLIHSLVEFPFHIPALSFAYALVFSLYLEQNARLMRQETH